MSSDQLGDDPAFALWQSHAPAVHAFLEISTQMRRVRTDTSVYLDGLDYGSARAGLEMAGVTVTPALWQEIRMIEAGAIEASRR